MFKIYILSILCTFSLMAMEKTQPKNPSSQHIDDLNALQQPSLYTSPFNPPTMINRYNNANTEESRSTGLSKEEASKIISNIIAILHIDKHPYITNEQIKSFKEALPLIGGNNIRTKIMWLNLAVKKKQYELVNILIDNGARVPITLIEECIKSPGKHDILRILIRKPILESNYLSANIFDNAIKYELVDVIANFIHLQKWFFSEDNLNQAIDKASSQKSSDIAILLLQNLSHLYERLNKDQAAKYINFIINSDSPKLIYDILIYYRSLQIPITIKDILHQLHVLNDDNDNNDQKTYLTELDKNIVNKLNKAIIASLSQLIESNSIDDFIYIYSFLQSSPPDLAQTTEFQQLIEQAYNAPNKHFITFLNHDKNIGKDKDRFIGPISPPPIAPKKLEKNLCAIFYNLNEPLAEYLHGYRIKCQYKENKVTIAINPMNDKILNIIYNIITKHRFSSIKDGHKIIINISSKDISDDMLKTLNHDLSDSVTKYIKKQKIIISRDNSISKGDNYSEEYHGSEIIPSNTTPKNPYKKLYNKKNITTSWDDFTKEAKGAKNTKEDHQQKNNKSKQNNNKSCPEKTPNKSIKHDNKNPKNSKKTVLPQQLSPLTDRNNTKKPYNKFNNDYHLTNNKEINPLSYKSPFLSDDNDNDIIIPNKDIKNSPNNLSITLLSNYYNFFKRISDDNIKEIFNHGIMAIDFSKMKHKTYINNINDGLKNFNNDIIPELNNIYNKFKEKYDIYLTENNDARIVEINHLLVWLQEEYQDLIANEDAAKGYLFILGEHLSRLFNNNQEEAINIIGDYYLLMRMKDFRNATKHSGDNKITTKEATYVIGEEPIAGYNSLLKDLYDKISQNPDKI